MHATIDDQQVQVHVLKHLEEVISLNCSIRVFL